MNIAYFLADPGIGIFGTKGASVHAQEMIRALRALGHEVTVFATKRGNKHGDPSSEYVPADLKDLPVFVVPVAGAKGAAAREQATARASARMAELAAEESYDLAYERYSLFSTAGTALKDRQRMPLVVEVNAPLLAEQSAHRQLHDTQTAMESTLRTFGAADVLSCVSTPVADWARCVSAGTDPRIIVTPNGVNVERFGRQRTTTPSSSRPFTVGFLGTLKPWHGTEFLLQAVAAGSGLAGIRVEILGDGPQRTELESLAVQLGIAERVVFHGAVAPEQVPAALSAWDAGVAPYPVPQQQGEHYFSPLKVYEYLAAGLPVVASATGEIPEIIEHGRTGLLVPGSDPDALAEALGRLAADPQLRQQMGAAARAEAQQRHSWQTRAAELLEAAGTALPSPVPVSEVIC
ncbi:glycosyltransferase family 4 protein [Nesterenkonia ebinurensis]|uniref:glycosyltransferase family 4 protein n=1 Tax=Nesterenkonia ebinurensis TaxID=2608252 RepID=UPI00123E138A|nr:glycosyltransferase family 4 protein [Nesterenkonia ebinurensis]